MEKNNLHYQAFVNAPDFENKDNLDSRIVSQETNIKDTKLLEAIRARAIELAQAQQETIKYELKLTEEVSKYFKSCSPL